LKLARKEVPHCHGYPPTCPACTC